MKTKKELNTLALNKRTVSRLTENEQRSAKGGDNIFVIVETKDCLLIPIDIPAPTATFATTWETDVVSPQG